MFFLVRHYPISTWSVVPHLIHCTCLAFAKLEVFDEIKYLPNIGITISNIVFFFRMLPILLKISRQLKVAYGTQEIEVQ